MRVRGETLRRPKPAANFRISLGAAKNHWNRLSPRSQSLLRIHVHIERGGFVVTNHIRPYQGYATAIRKVDALVALDEMLVVLGGLKPNDPDIVCRSLSARSDGVASMMLESVSIPGKFAEVRARGYVWYAVVFDQGFTWVDVDEQVDLSVAKQYLQRDIDLAVAYLRRKYRIQSSGRLRLPILVIELDDEEVRVNQNLGASFRTLYNRWFGLRPQHDGMSGGAPDRIASRSRRLSQASADARPDVLACLRQCRSDRELEHL